MAKSKSYMAAYRAAKGEVAEPGMRFEPWTRETYPGIWLPRKTWDRVNTAINGLYENEEEAIPGSWGSIVVGKTRYTYSVLEYDDYIITDKERVSGIRRKRR